ncbi:MAG: hypothetical protein EPN91_06810 [Salinibacterium sp.]|nr:MAG: hypothetical protein EPN91_06810 [Salinibacterium sp.]
MIDPDPDMAILEHEALTAQTPTRRAWARRLLVRLRGHERLRADLTRTFSYSTTPSSHGAEDPPDSTS